MKEIHVRHPGALRNLHEVAQYWRQCLESHGADELDTAARMVEVVSNPCDDEWSQNPIYSLIFEIAASLETPLAGDRRQRDMRWDCIRALISVLERYAGADAQKTDRSGAAIAARVGGSRS